VIGDEPSLSAGGEPGEEVPGSGKSLTDGRFEKRHVRPIQVERWVRAARHQQEPILRECW
jgi:hypothetical protein